MEQRLFGERVPQLEKRVDREEKETNVKILPWIERNEIGVDTIIETPYGKRTVIYTDYTASARAIRPIEDYIVNEVLPLYGNTHSSVTVTSEQTTLFVHEARQEVRAMTGAGDGDSVIFTGSGTTAAVELLLHLIQTDNIVVINSIHEHHSNLLPWRTITDNVYCVQEDESGSIDIDDLQSTLRQARENHPTAQLIASFTASSNVTGILMNVQAITSIVKQFDCLSFWDYASAAPYVDINVNGSVPLDAVFFSGHKFIGGVSSPGVLVVKKSIVKTTRPKRIGGGTVFFVSAEGEWYLKDAEYREEGGTPDSIGAIRLALAAKLKRTVGTETIIKREEEITRRFLHGIQNCDNISLLGPARYTHRIPVFSFLVKDASSGLFFHHNYISVLLNDLFGIQSRAGCMCAGPYAHRLLGISSDLVQSYLTALRESDDLDRTHLRRVGEYSQHEILRPGFTRISIPYFWNDKQVDELIQCVRFISERAADFIHLYQMNCESAEWHHHKQRTFHGRKWIGHITFTSKGMQVETKKVDSSGISVNIAKLIDEAEVLAEEGRTQQTKISVPDGRTAIDAHVAQLRWFVLPVEVVEYRKGMAKTQVPPFTPKTYSCHVNPERLSVSQLISNSSNIVNDHEDYSEEAQEEEQKAIEGNDHTLLKQEDGNTLASCDPCSTSNGGVTTECPLDPADQGKGRMGDLNTDENPEEVKEMEDWNRRVIVKHKEMNEEEAAKQPWHNPPLELYKKVTEAIHGLNMIKDGDRILVCLSGGKDSLALLHILHFYQLRCRKNKSTQFELGAITVDPGSTAYNPRPLIEYCRSLNIDYFYEEQDIIGAARRQENLRSICAFCSRMKRGRLAAAAQLHGWNVLAMGHHLDDLAESFFIAAFQNGNLSTMKAQYTTRDRLLRVIRPLIFVREKSLREFSESQNLPVVAENCPACFNQATERHRIKQLLAQQELVFPDLFHSLRSALRPLLLVDSASTDEMRSLAIQNIVKHNKNGGK